MDTSSDFVGLVQVVGTFALLAIASLVTVIVLISIIDRHPRQKLGPERPKDSQPRKP